MNGCHLAVFSVYIAFACHFVVTHPPPLSYSIGVLVVLAMPVKIYLKWQAIQLTIHSVIDE